MKIRQYLTSLAVAVIFSTSYSPAAVNPKAFGAKGDGRTNDTKAIQKAIDRVKAQGGGEVQLPGGHYLVDSLILPSRVSLVGEGIAATIIAQNAGTNADCIKIPAESAGIRIEHLSITGQDYKNYGIHFCENRLAKPGKPENIEFTSSLCDTVGLAKFLRRKNISEEWKERFRAGEPVGQHFKWAYINDVNITLFDIGFYAEAWSFGLDFCNSFVEWCGEGVLFDCTDSAIYNCYVGHCRRSGFVLSHSNNRVNNIKSIFNGIDNPSACAAVVISGSRNMICNVETQDNMCKGFDITGKYNMLSNCISNTDGYTSKRYHYERSTNAVGFRIAAPFNEFASCMVTNYNEKYGAIYRTPLMVEDEVAYFYPDIHDRIRVFVDNNMLMFNEPMETIAKGVSKSKPVQKGSRLNFAMEHDIDMRQMNAIIDFVFNGEDIQLWSAGDAMALSYSGGAYVLSIYGEAVCSLPVAHPELLKGRKARVTCEIRGETVCITSFQSYPSKGYLKKSSRSKLSVSGASVIPSGGTVSSNANPSLLVMTEEILPEESRIPFVSTAGLSAGAWIYYEPAQRT